MNSLVAGARRLLGRGTPLDSRVVGLANAVDAARGRLDEDVIESAAGVVERASARLRLSGDHTVVALAGATGSGKSSTFNAMSGLNLAAVGVRRPTTSYATACTWGESSSVELLEWLGIPPRHQVTRDSMLDSGLAERKLEGLVLLDLPDHDSTEVAHHLEVERLIKKVDLMVWVLDPQKYADAAVHDRYLRPLARHKRSMMIVLNHIDEVPTDRQEGVLQDVRRVLERDGLAGVPLIATSARTGQGIEDLKAAIAKRVSEKAASRMRLMADLVDTAEMMGEHSGTTPPPELQTRDKQEMIDALADAAGVPLVVDAVRRATRYRARRATGFPLTSWISKFRPDPLKRLHLDQGASGRDIVAAARSSIPQADQVQQARVESTVRSLADELTAELKPPWVRAVRKASTSRFDDLSDGLDRALVTTELGVGSVPQWCRVVQVLQWTLLLVGIFGAAWLTALAGMSWLNLTVSALPEYFGLALPTLMLVFAIVAGLFLALLSRAMIALSSRAKARKAERRLRKSVAEVADSLVVIPIETELEAYRQVWQGLRDVLP